MPQYDSSGAEGLRHLPRPKLFAVIDPSTDKVVGRYPVGDAKAIRHGARSEHHRAFLDAKAKRMTVFDLDAHKPICPFAQRLGRRRCQFDPD